MHEEVVHTHNLPNSVGQRVRLLPAVPPGLPNIDGLTVHHKLMCLGHYEESLESHIVSIADLTVVTGPVPRAGAAPTLTSEFSVLGAWESPGAVTDVHVCDLGGGDVLLVVGTSQGSAWCTRLLLPRTPGATPEDVALTQLQTEEGNPQRLAPQYTTLHRGAVASADVQPETRVLLTCGDDGGLCLVDLEKAVEPGGGDEGVVRRVARGVGRGLVGCAAYSNARWVDTSTFATVEVSGRLAVWDVREGSGKPLCCAPLPWGHGVPRPGQPLPGAGSRGCWWLAVHAARPNLAATAGSLGEVALWDLRLASQPILAMAPDGDMGDAWEVLFDPLQQQHSAALVPAVSGAVATAGGGAQLGLLYCTSEGTLGLASPTLPSASASTQLPPPEPMDGAWPQQPAWGTVGKDPAGSTSRTLYRSPHGTSINSLDAQGSDVVAVTDANELIYVRRGAGSAT